MFNNVGNLDRIFRLILATLFLYVAFNRYPGTNIALGLEIGSALLIISSVFGFCGLYRLFGINTSKSQN